MSDLTFNQYSRLSVSLERQLMRAAVTERGPVYGVTVAKNALAFLRKAAIATGNYLVDVSRALDEARAKDVRFSRSHW